MDDKLSKFKVLTTPFSIISSPKELLYHSILHTLLDVKGLRAFKKISLDLLDSRLNMSDPERGLKENFNGYELNMFYHGLFSSTGKIHPKRVEMAKKIFKNIYAVHGNYEAPIGSYHEHKLNFASELSSEKKKLLIANLIVANELITVNSLRPIILHGGYGKKSTALDNVIRNVEFALNYSAKNNLKLDILLENLPKDNPYYVMTDVDDLQYVNETLKDNNFGFCFDLGHAGSAAIVEEGNNDNFKREHAIIDLLGNSIKYAHLNYNESHLMTKEDVSKYNNLVDIDWHGVFPLKDAKTMLQIKQVLEKLKSKTDVGKIQMVNFEIFPKHYFPNKKFKIEAFPNGYQNKSDVTDSVKFIKNCFY